MLRVALQLAINSLATYFCGASASLYGPGGPAVPAQQGSVVRPRPNRTATPNRPCSPVVAADIWPKPSQIATYFLGAVVIAGCNVGAPQCLGKDGPLARRDRSQTATPHRPCDPAGPGPIARPRRNRTATTIQPYSPTDPVQQALIARPSPNRTLIASRSGDPAGPMQRGPRPNPNRFCDSAVPRQPNLRPSPSQAATDLLTAVVVTDRKLGNAQASAAASIHRHRDHQDHWLAWSFSLTLTTQPPESPSRCPQWPTGGPEAQGHVQRHQPQQTPQRATGEAKWANCNHTSTTTSLAAVHMSIPGTTINKRRPGSASCMVATEVQGVATTGSYSLSQRSHNDVPRRPAARKAITRQQTRRTQYLAGRSPAFIPEGRKYPKYLSMNKLRK